MFRQMLMGSAMRVHAPENDEGADEFEDDIIDDAEDELDEEDLDPDADADGDSGEPDEDEPEQRKPTRGENRVAAATRAAKEAREEAAAARRELEAERASRNQVPPAELQRRRDEHLATLTGDQRTEFLLNEMRQENQRRDAQLRFETWDVSDKANFAALAAKSPAIRALEAEVEDRLTLLRKDGGNIAREAVAKFLLGEKAMAKATRANNKGEKRAAAGRDRQTVRPGSSRGDVAADRGRRSKDDNSVEALENRLRGVKI